MVSTENKVTFTEWFDVYNPEHLEAYKHLIDKGFWPDEFIMGIGATMGENWYILIAFKLARAYIKDKLGER